MINFDDEIYNLYVGNFDGGRLFFRTRFVVRANQLFGINLPPENDSRFNRTQFLQRLGSIVHLYSRDRVRGSGEKEEYNIDEPLTPRGTHFLNQEVEENYERQMLEVNTTAYTLVDLRIPFQARIIENECVDINGVRTDGPARIRPIF